MRRQAQHLSDDLCCIVLAAGGSRRLGRTKQLVRYTMRPLLLRADASAAAVAPGNVIIVLGAESLRLRALLRRHRSKATIVKNSLWRHGLAGSLCAGLDAAPRSVKAALVLLTDQPRVSIASLHRLIAAWRARPGRPAAANFEAKVGVPAILPRALWRQVRLLDGDVGARAILRQADDITLVDIPEAAFDIDTVADLENLQRSRS